MDTRAFNTWLTKQTFGSMAILSSGVAMRVIYQEAESASNGKTRRQGQRPGLLRAWLMNVSR